MLQETLNRMLNIVSSRFAPLSVPDQGPSLSKNSIPPEMALNRGGRTLRGGLSEPRIHRLSVDVLLEMQVRTRRPTGAADISYHLPLFDSLPNTAQ